MGKSGDPRKQERPDGEPSEAERAREGALLAAQITAAAPPAVSGVVTSVEGKVVDFPLFAPGKAIDLIVNCGPLGCHLHLDPDFAEPVCAEIMKAANEIRSAVRPARMEDVADVARQAQAVRG